MFAASAVTIINDAWRVQTCPSDSTSPAGLDDVDGYKNLQELLSKLDSALHVAPQTKETATAVGGGSSTAAGGPRGNLAEPLVCHPAPRLSADTGHGTEHEI